MSVGFRTGVRERESESVVVVLDVDMSLEIKCDMCIGDVGKPLPSCSHPAKFWTYWRCPTHGNLRIATCDMHLAIAMRDLAMQAKGHMGLLHATCGKRITYIRAKAMK